MYGVTAQGSPDIHHGSVHDNATMTFTHLVQLPTLHTSIAW
jgi:hypothetical protein